MTLVKFLQLFRSRLQIKQCLNFFSRNSSFLAVHLSNRKFVRAFGPDSINHLQSLLTNDVRHLCPSEDIEQKNALYAYLLNHLGRILCDVILYRGKVMNEGELLMEVDAELAEALEKFMKKFSIRRKVKFELADDVESWILIPKSQEAVGTLTEVVSDDLTLVEDPRLPQLGYRFISRLGVKTVEDISKFVNAPLEEGTLDHHQIHRYRLGIGEGGRDHPAEECLPQESNGDILHGISFQKGCYIGQELTSRVYHTGVVRKRLMPIEILCDEEKIAELSLSSNTIIKNEEDKKVGKLRSYFKNVGLALLRIEEALKSKKLILSDSEVEITTSRPFWWPVDKEDKSGKPKIETVEVQRARLLYQSRKRGMLENCLLLGTFAHKYLQQMNKSQLDMYDHLINTPSNDWDIFKWATGAQPIPPEYDNEIMHMFVEHCKNPDRETRFQQPDL